jgi:hypothetical protein
MVLCSKRRQRSSQERKPCTTRDPLQRFLFAGSPFSFHNLSSGRTRNTSRVTNPQLKRRLTRSRTGALELICAPAFDQLLSETRQIRCTTRTLRGWACFFRFGCASDRVSSFDNSFGLCGYENTTCLKSVFYLQRFIKFPTLTFHQQANHLQS